MVTALAGCWSYSPAGTVEVTEQDYETALEELEGMRDQALSASQELGGTDVRRGVPGLVKCGQVSSDATQKLSGVASFLVRGETLTADEIERRLARTWDDRWDRVREEGSSASVWSRSTPADVDLELELYVLRSEDPAQPGQRVSIMIEGSCMKMSDDLRDQAKDDLRERSEAADPDLETPHG